MVVCEADQLRPIVAGAGPAAACRDVPGENTPLIIEVIGDMVESVPGTIACVWA